MQRSSCFFYGIAMGTAAGLLLAPMAGNRARALLARRARNSMRKARMAQGLINDRVTSIRDGVAGKVIRGRKALRITTDGVVGAVKAGKQALAG